jgi:hypothetical protein
MIEKTFKLTRDKSNYGNYYDLPDNTHVICADFIHGIIKNKPEQIEVNVSNQPQEGFTKATIIYYEDEDEIDWIEVNSRKFTTLHRLDKLIFETFGKGIKQFFFKTFRKGIKQFYFKIEEVS